jgi:sporulation protein YlmC with PRC-barrel domain
VQDDDIREKIEDLTGYTVLSSDGTELGVIKEIIPNPGQW